MATIPPPFSLPPPPPPPPDNIAGSGAPAATLLVRNLPESIPEDMLARIFSNYGASAVRPCAGGKLRNCAFVDFKDESVATQAQSYFNRLNFLGKVLRVERAHKDNSNNADTHCQNQPARISTSANAIPLSEISTNLKNSVSAAEPIAPRLGVEYPFPPHLEYAYPPPDGNILTNILNALIAVPRFYVQVLHLMNKMNIPAPFRAALPTPPLPPAIPASPPPPPPPASKQTHLADLSSDESEMESSEEDAGDLPAKKRRKREAIIGPAVDRNVAHEAVGVKPAPLLPKELPVIKKKNPVLQIKIAPKTTPKETADNDNGTTEFELGSEHLNHNIFATPQEIESGKLPAEEILSLPMFKNYSPGNPANVLYIKNLAKDVIVDDFYFIFGSIFGSADAAKSSLNIKLMQEGRMRGQAFVTFPSVDLAQHALNLANGYIFKGKPMIIQFGRSPAAAKTS